MFALLLLFTPALSASITSTTFTFQGQSNHTGAVERGEYDGYRIEVTSSSVVHTLAISLQVLQGDADLRVYTEVNGVERMWSRGAGGSDYLEIMETDELLIGDGMGLQRWFEIYVYGFSSTLSRYTLTITAVAASKWTAPAKETLKTHMAARRNEALFTMAKLEGDAIKRIETEETGSSWLGVVGGVVLLGAGVCAWRKWGGKQGKNEELAYRLI